MFQTGNYFTRIRWDDECKSAILILHSMWFEDLASLAMKKHSFKVKDQSTSQLFSILRAAVSNLKSLKCYKIFRVASMNYPTGEQKGTDCSLISGLLVLLLLLSA